MSESEKMMAPNPLPEVLPAGTRWGRTTYGGGLCGVFTEDARWSTHEAKYIGIGNEADRDTARYVAIERIDWPSYYAALAASSPVEWKPGDAVIGVQVNSGETIRGFVASWQTFGSWDGIAAVNVVPTLGGSRAGDWLRTDSLRPAPAQPEAKATADTMPPCSGCGALGWVGPCPSCSIKPVEAKRVDPYASQNDHDVHAANWGNAPANIARYQSDRTKALGAAIAAARKQQALDAIGSNEHIRTGPLRDRDKYGQKLSLKGWETED